MATAAAAAAPAAVARPDVHARDGETAEVTKLREALDLRTDIPETEKETVRLQLARLADPVQRAILEQQLEKVRKMSEAEKDQGDHERAPKQGGWSGLLSLSPQALELLASALGA